MDDELLNLLLARSDAANDALEHAYMLWEQGEINITQLDKVITDGRPASYALMVYVRDHYTDADFTD